MFQRIYIQFICCFDLSVFPKQNKNMTGYFQVLYHFPLCSIENKRLHIQYIKYLKSKQNTNKSYFMYLKRFISRQKFKHLCTKKKSYILQIQSDRTVNLFIYIVEGRQFLIISNIFVFIQMQRKSHVNEEFKHPTYHVN